MSKVIDGIMVVWRVRIILLRMKVGCSVVTLESCGLVGGCLHLCFRLKARAQNHARSLQEWSIIPSPACYPRDSGVFFLD